LKVVCEKTETNSLERPKELTTINGFPIFETIIPGRIYAMIRRRVSFAEVDGGTYYPKTMGELMGKIAQHKLEITGTVYAIGYEYDEKKKEMDLAIGVPIARIPTGAFEGFQVVNVPAKSAYGTDYYGAYQGSGKAHETLMAYLAKQKIDSDGTWMEEYLTDPGKEADTAKWLTRIYWPVKPQ
jgi:effector-binding domain-containing protein